MFGLFKKRPVLPIQSDKIWKSEAEKDIGLVNDIAKYVSADQCAVLFYFFEKSKEEIKTVLTDRNMAFSEDITESSKLYLICAQDIDRSSAFSNVMSAKFRTDLVQLLFAEHYPTKTLENVLIATLKDMSEENISITFYLSLESRLLRMFGSERIAKIMDSGVMGLKEGECIEHSMITKSILRAQMKIEQNLSNEIKCDSQDEWFDKNFPESL